MRKTAPPRDRIRKSIVLSFIIFILAICSCFSLISSNAFAGGSPVDKFVANVDGAIPSSTIRTVSDFDLNNAKLVGGKNFRKDSIPGCTAVTSPDGKFNLVQGKRMFLEYLDKGAINLKGQYGGLPGEATLQWDNAAVDKVTGEFLDVQVTLSNINMRVADLNNKIKTPPTRKDLDDERIAVMINWQEMGEVSQKKDLHSSETTYSPLSWFNKKGFSSLSTVSHGFYPDGKDSPFNHWSWYTYSIKFLNKDGSENNGRYNMVVTDIDVAGMPGSLGKFYLSYNMSDRAQEHVKILNPRDSMNVTKDTVLKKVFSGGKLSEVWSTRALSNEDTFGWVLLNIGSGSSIEVGNSGGMNLFSQLEPVNVPPGKLKIVKTGGGKKSGTVSFLKNSEIEFRYEVTNIGSSLVNGIMVKDDRGVKVSCPKTKLIPGESMLCKGNGVIVPN